MSHRQMAVPVVMLLFGLPACLGPDVCLTNDPPGVVVRVSHATTEAPIAGALAVARDGSFADSAETDSGGTGRIDLDRAGTYDVSVSKEGFQTWTTSNVGVELDECGKERTAEFDVELAPQ